MSSNLRMLDPIHPEGNVPAPSSPHTRHFLPLAAWARSPRAEADLERIYGPSLNWPIAFQWLESFRRSDFSQLPPVHTLSSSAMPGLWGGYSRETREIYLAADCPPHLVASVLLEEVGHFLDQELCNKETPGDEGALFAACVLGEQPTDADFSAWAAEESLSPVFHSGRRILVEAAPKVRGSGSTGTSSSSGGKVRGGSGNQGSRTVGQNTENSRIIGDIVYAVGNSVRLNQTKAGQTMIGSAGNDTFVVMSSDAKIEDPNRGIDTVEAKVSFDLSKFSFIENLTAAPGTAAVTLGGNSNANVITGNSGNNRLDGGADRARDTLSGGLGNDSYVIRDTLDAVVEAANGGIDTIETTINNFTLNFANVENVAFVGAGSATLTGNSLANVLTGGTLGDSLIGGSGNSPADTLRGGQGDDIYIVSRQTDRIEEGNGPLDGTDTIRTSAMIYNMAGFANVENLVYTGSSNSNLTGNASNNTIEGGNTVKNNINGEAGDDYLIGGVNRDTLIGGLGNDTLVVTRWADVPVGGLGTSLAGSSGSDILNGGEGADWYVVNAQSGYTFIESATDVLSRDTIASTVNYSLKNSGTTLIEDLYLIGKTNLTGTGNDLDNKITGNDGNNALAAGKGNDTVYGGLGADVVNGEAGDDTIYGGGSPQEVAADRSTPIILNPGESYEGKIDLFRDRKDTDWIAANLTEGITYTFELKFSALGAPGLRQFSDAAFGEAGRDIMPSTRPFAWWSFFNKNRNVSFLPFIGDANAFLNSLLYNSGSSQVNEAIHRTDHSILVFDSKGQAAVGSIQYNPNDRNDVNQNDNIIRFQFTPFTTGEFFVPISGAGPLGGVYTVSLTDPDTVGLPPKPILGDDAKNTLIGGLGNDYIVGGNGRDSLRAPLGDLLFGGTNGVLGGVDVDTVAGQNSDTLIGGDGNDTLDGGRGADLMVGGDGNDVYFVDNDSTPITLGGTVFLGDQIVETDDGGEDLAIFSLAAERNFDNDLKNGFFDLTDPDLDSVTGAGFDVDLKNVYLNVEHASLMGSANLYVLGNEDANSLIGNFGKNLLVGDDGNDTLDGKGGNDYLVGGEGGDWLDGGSGQNTMDGGLGSDTYIVNDRDDRIIKEVEGLDGGEDLVRTYFNFDPIQGDGVKQFDPLVPDNSPSVTKSQSFASTDLEIFYNLEHFELLGQAAYGVGNALANSITASAGTSALLLGMGGEDTLLGNNPVNGAGGNDSLFGDTPRFYALPDLYAPAPTDTRTQEFLDKIIGQYGSDYLDGKDGNDYLDGGRSFDTMIGGRGNDTMLQDHVDDFIIATVEGGINGRDELITSVNIDQAPDGINDLMLVVKDQDRDPNGHSITGQEQVASFASFLGSTGSNKASYSVTVDITVSVGVDNANRLELMYSYNDGDIYRSLNLDEKPANLFISDKLVDFNDNTKVAYELSWSAQPYDESGVVGYTVRYRKDTVIGDLVFSGVESSKEIRGVTLTFQKENSDGILKANQKLSVQVDGRNIVVYLATDGNRNISTNWNDLKNILNGDADASKLISVNGSGSGLVTEVSNQDLEIWKTYLDGTSQDLRGTQPSPTLLVDNLAPGSYQFEVVSNRLAMPVVRDFSDPKSPTFGSAIKEQVVTLQGGGGNDFITAQKLVYGLSGGLADDGLTDPQVLNNPLNPLPFGFIFSPEPVDPNKSRQIAFAAYLDGGAGNDLLVAAEANNGLGVDYEFQGITFSGLNTMVGGQGSDTFVVRNGGIALEDGGAALATPFDHVIKYGNETPVVTQEGNFGSSLNGGQHNLIVSEVPILVLSDTVVSQGKFIDQVILSGAGRFAMGNRLDNFLAEGNIGGGTNNTLVGGVGRDSIRGGALGGDVLVGGTAFGVDNVGLAIKDFASKTAGGRELKTSIFRDTDPIPVALNGPAFADPSQFWFVPGYYGEVFDPNRNRDTLVAADSSILDGGAGHDSLVGSTKSDHFFVSGSYNSAIYPKNISYVLGGSESRNIDFQDAVFGNGGNDTVTFTDSDRLWWSGYAEGAWLPKNGYYLGSESNAISNLILQMGSPTARDGTGNRTSTGNAGNGGNRIVGNEFDNVLNGRGVGGDEQKGTGIDYLTGNGGRDNFLIDVYDDGYKNNNTYRESSSNVWEPAIRTIPSSGSTARHEWNPGLSKYQDFDYVVVTDFETIDNLTLAFPLSDYSIGNIPDQLDNPGGNVGPLGNQLTSKDFGIYYTGNTFASGDKQGLYKPNLVVVIRSNYNLLGPDDDGNGIPDALVSRPFSASNAFTDSNVAPPLMGWGRFYELASSPFASYVNKPYNQADSFASLSTLVRSGNDSLEALKLSGDSLRGLGGNDTLVGKIGNDTLLGGIGADTLFGNLGNDSLLGEDGDDYLDGGANNDVMIGGVGNDTFFVDSLSDIVTEDSNSGTDFVVASISNYTLANNVENLVLDGLAGSGSGNGLNNRLIGNSLDNTLYGLGGDDTLIGGGGTNTLDGGLGNDFYIVNSVIDTIEDIGGTIDTVVTSVSFDISNALVAGGTGIENLRLSSSNSANLSGNASDNLIVGNIGNDSIFGGNGNDTLRGTSELGAKEIDTLTGGGGADWFVLGDSSNLFYNALAERGDYVIITDFSQLQGDILQLTKGFQYLVSNAPLSTDPPIGASNSYLYRDNGNGSIGTEDNLIAAINATDGPITSLNNIAKFV